MTNQLSILTTGTFRPTRTQHKHDQSIRYKQCSHWHCFGEVLCGFPGERLFFHFCHIYSTNSIVQNWSPLSPQIRHLFKLCRLSLFCNDEWHTGIGNNTAI